LRIIISPFHTRETAAVKDLYRKSFAGPPWNENLTGEEIDRRWAYSLARDGFVCRIAKDSLGRLAGVMWLDTPTDEFVASERGPHLLNRVREIHPDAPIVWCRDTMVSMRHTGRGVAKLLKLEEFPKVIAAIKKSQGVDAVICVTRMRDDNPAIISINERLGFQRSGIRHRCSSNPRESHEFWTSII
jgi:hypothetical protein